MLNRKSLIATLVAVAVAGGSLPAMAAPIPVGSSPLNLISSSDAAYQPAVQNENVKKKKKYNQRSGKNQKWSYDRKRNGHRYKTRRNGYNYYYGGYYYQKPWWTLAPGISIQIF